MTLNPVVAEVTARIVERSRATRADYLRRMDAAAASGVARAKLSCANWAHAFAGQTIADKLTAMGGQQPNVGVVTAYNDMLSAHQPFERFPAIVREATREVGATAQVAGGVPAMCDGVTQGRPGMELSLFSRDVIAMSTGVGLTHDAFDAVVALGVCDKIVISVRIVTVKPLDQMTTGLKQLRIFMRGEEPLKSIERHLSRGKGDGDVSLVLMLDKGQREVEVQLPGRYLLSPQIAGALRAVSGVVQVELV